MPTEVNCKVGRHRRIFSREVLAYIQTMQAGRKKAIFMTTSETQDFLPDVLASEKIPSGKLAYFEARLAGMLHQAMLKIFGKLEREKKLTRAQLARRIGTNPQQIARILSYPGNLTIGTVSNLFLGTGYELEGIVLTNLATGERIRIPRVIE